MSSPIVPEMTLSALLQASPSVGDVLLASVPGLAALRHPVLCDAVARTSTIEQVARLGGVNVDELVAKLRTAAGVGAVAMTGSNAAGGAPRWLAPERVRHEIDGGAMLEAGVHPIGKVRELTAGLAPGDMVRLITPFRPEPLLAAMRNAGFDVFSSEVGAGRHETYIRRPE